MKSSASTGVRLPDYFFDDPDRAERWLTRRMDGAWRKKKMDAYKGEMAAALTKLNWLIARTQPGAVRVDLESHRDALAKLEDRVSKMTDEELKAVVA